MGTRMNQAGPLFGKSNLFERTLNKAFGVLVGLGIGLRHNHLVEVRGRTLGGYISLQSICWSSRKGGFSSLPEDARNGFVMPSARAKSFLKEGV